MNIPHLFYIYIYIVKGISRCLILGTKYGAQFKQFNFYLPLHKPWQQSATSFLTIPQILAKIISNIWHFLHKKRKDNNNRPNIASDANTTDFVQIQIIADHVSINSLVDSPLPCRTNIMYKHFGSLSLFLSLLKSVRA